MARRLAASLLAQVERWHRGLRRIGGFVEWPRSGIEAFELETGQESKNLRVWRIRELPSSADLLACLPAGPGRAGGGGSAGDRGI